MSKLSAWIAAVVLLMGSASMSSGATGSNGRIILLFAFAWEGDSASANLERSFRFAADRKDASLSLDVVRCGSASETARACDSLMRQDDVKLVVFAGDEGPATVAAMMSAAKKVPVLKLTSDPYSLASLSDHLFEFLPSGERQAQVLGEFAIRGLGLKAAMIFAPQDARGRALAEGFKQSFADGGGYIERQSWYAPDAMAIRPNLDGMFADSSRLVFGGTQFKTSLSSAERAQVFGHAQGGEVLYAEADDSVRADSARTDSDRAVEGLFFTLAPDRVETFAKQLPPLGKSTVLLGNSSWVDLDALARRSTVTEGMYIVLPLMPDALDTTGFLASYQQTGARVNEWALLGLDAGRFVGRLIATNPRTRQDVIKALTEAPRMTGISVIVDFQKGHENTAARIVRYEDGDLRVVR